MLLNNLLNFRKDHRADTGVYAITTTVINAVSNEKITAYKGGYKDSYSIYNNGVEHDRLDDYPELTVLGIGFITTSMLKSLNPKKEICRCYDTDLRNILLNKNLFGNKYENAPKGVIDGKDEEWLIFTKEWLDNNPVVDLTEEFWSDLNYAAIIWATETQPEKRITEAHDLMYHQNECVKRIVKQYKKEKRSRVKNKLFRFLIAMKCRSGKTFTTLVACVELGFKRILILTYRPTDTRKGWENTTLHHTLLYKYKWCVKNPSNVYENSLSDMTNKDYYVCFSSFQGLLSGNSEYSEQFNELIHNTNWDAIIIDEDHYGADKETGRAFIDELTTKCIFYVTGTPSLELARGEFDSNHSFFFTYTTEQCYKKDNVTEYNGKKLSEWYKNAPKAVYYGISVEDYLKDEFKKSGLTFNLNELLISNNKKFEHELMLKTLFRRLRVTTHKFNEPDRSKLALFTNLGCRNIVIKVALKKTVDALKILLEEMPEYDDTVILTLTGENPSVKDLNDLSDKITKANSEGKKTITLTVNRGNTGITIKEWDTAVLMYGNEEGISNMDAYIQFTSRAGSSAEGKLQYNIIDLNPARILEAVMYEARIVATNENTSINKVLGKVINNYELYLLEELQFNTISELNFEEQYRAALKKDGIINSLSKIALSNNLLLSGKSCTDTVTVELQGQDEFNKSQRDNFATNNSTAGLTCKKDITEKEAKNFAIAIDDCVKVAFLNNNCKLTNIKSLEKLLTKKYDDIKTDLIEFNSNVANNPAVFDNIVTLIKDDIIANDIINNLIVLYYKDKCFDEIFIGQQFPNSGYYTPTALVTEMISKL